MVTEVLRANLEDRLPVPAGVLSTSLMTPLGLVQGDILIHLEEYGATTLRYLIQSLEWPSRMVMMGVGGLIRQGLVRAVQLELDVVIEVLPREARDARHIVGGIQ